MRVTILVFGFFLLTRLVFLLTFPVFNDEAMYMRWGLMFSRDPSLWLMSVDIDGKQPALPVLLGIISQFPFDLLILSRLFSVFVSAGIFWAVMDISSGIMSRKSRIVALVLLTVTPYILQYNRLALMETPVMAAHIVTLALVMRFLKSGRHRYVFLSAVVTAAGWWFKTTSILTVPAVIAGLLFSGGRVQTVAGKFWAIFQYCAVFFLLTAPLRLHPAYALIPVRELERALTPAAIFEFPWQLWLKNLIQAGWFLGVYLTMPVFILSLLGFARIRGAARATGWAIVLFALVPLVLEIMVSRIFTSRYLVIVAPVFVIAAAIAVDRADRQFRMIMVLIAFFTASAFAGLLVIRPALYYRSLSFAPVVQEDFGQYIRGWSSGWGIREATDLVKKTAASGRAVVFIRSDSGNPEDAVVVSMWREPNISVYYVNDLNAVVPEMNARHPGTKYFFVSRGAQYAGLDPLLEEIGRFDNPFGSGDFVGVYRLHIPGTDADLGSIDFAGKQHV